MSKNFAPIYKRFFSYMIDLLLIGIVNYLIIMVTHKNIFLFLYAGYFIWFFSTSGCTLGATLVGVKVVYENGTPLNFKSGILRTIGFIFSTAIFGIGVLWMLWDYKRQTLYDKLAGTIVVVK